MADTDETPTEKPSETDGPACTLPADAMAERADRIRETVEPHLIEVTADDDGLTFRFERDEAVYEAVSDLLWKEADCCAFATHELRVPEHGDHVEWRWETDDEGVDVLREASARFDVLEIPG